MMVMWEQPVSSRTESTVSSSVQLRAGWLNWCKWQQICLELENGDILVSANSVKIGETDGTSVNKQGNKLWEVFVLGKKFFRSLVLKQWPKVPK